MATRDKAAGWEHFKKLVDKVLRKYDFEIGLLIGANSAKVLERQQLVPSRDGGPYSFRSPLGWCVKGPLTKGTKMSIA